MVLTKVGEFCAIADGSEVGRSSTSGAVVERSPSEEADTANGVPTKSIGFAVTALGSKAGRSLLRSDVVTVLH